MPEMSVQRGEYVMSPLPKTKYDTMTLHEIIFDFGYVRGDLVEKYARDALVGILEKREAALRAELADRDVEAQNLRAELDGARQRLHGQDDEYEDFGPPLLITPGDCEFHGECGRCGKHLGTIRPNQRLDVLGEKWDRHANHPGQGCKP